MNLWTEFDDEHFPTEPTRSGRTRKITEQVVLSALRGWLLSDYVASYCRSLGATRIYRRCYWIDALGISGGSSQQAHGTQELITSPEKGRKKQAAQASIPPVLQPVVSLSQALALESRPITLTGLILDAGSSKRKETRATGIEHTPPLPLKGVMVPKESGIVRASWLEVAPLLLKEIDQSPAIFLLNPFGHTIFTYDDLAPLYQRTAPTELCLLISHKQIETRLLAVQNTPTGAKALTTLLRTDRWKTLLTNGAVTEQAINGFIDLFLASMQKHFLSVLPVPFLMHMRPAAVEPTPYILLFATRRQDSLACMNDALCLYRRRLYEQSHQGVLGEEWFATQQRERFAKEKEQLYQRALHQGQSQRPRRWPDFRQQLLLANFGQFTVNEYNEVIQGLLTSKVVRCEWKRTNQDVNDTAAIENPRVPGNDDMLWWS